MPHLLLKQIEQNVAAAQNAYGQIQRSFTCQANGLTNFPTEANQFLGVYLAANSSRFKPWEQLGQSSNGPALSKDEAAALKFRQCRNRALCCCPMSLAVGTMAPTIPAAL
jgi:hypothetical protein